MHFASVNIFQKHSGGCKFFLYYDPIPTFHALLVAGGGLAVTPDVVKNYYASVEAEHNDIAAKVEELLTNYQVCE